MVRQYTCDDRIDVELVYAETSDEPFKGLASWFEKEVG
jgi:hypothetical protein